MSVVNNKAIIKNTSHRFLYDQHVNVMKSCMIFSCFMAVVFFFTQSQQIPSGFIFIQE